METTQDTISTNADTSALQNHASPVPPLTLEAIFNDKLFEAKQLRQPHWLKDGRRFSFVDAAGDKEALTLWIFDVESQSRLPLLDVEMLKADGEPLVIHGYQWSPDETQILFAREPRAHDPEGDKALYIFTFATGKLRCIQRTDQEYRNVKWSPDGRRLGYVRGDDLYVLDLAAGEETRLTGTASSAVYNGRLGWVYQEELDLVDGWEWSPDGRYIAYFQMDETQVPIVPLPRYEDLHLAPELQRYPKAGDPNPLVKIGAIDLENINSDADSPVETMWVDLGPDPDIYIAAMQWTPTGDLLLQRIPRLQNRLDLLRVDLQTGAVTTLLTETDEAWVDAPGKLMFAGDTGDFLWLSDRSGYKQLYLYDRYGQLLRQLTGGDWDVSGMLSVDREAGCVYFSAAHPAPHERHLFRISLNGGEPVQITRASAMHHGLFAPDAKTFLHTFSARTTPPRVEFCRADGERIAAVLDNPLPAAQAAMRSEWEFTSFQTSEGITLQAAILRPPDFESARKYPVLMYTYGGPGSQVVQDGWGSRVGLEQYLAQNGYILALVDGRGAGGRGRDFKKATYLQLGRHEVDDQIAGARWLCRLPYVDGARIGIWGWSYGGFMASLCILRGADVFRAAVAVAPVTHWKLYDSIYTERYMRRPEANPEGYERNSPLKYAEQLKGKFLLMHGLADDNVHFQNAAQLAELFQKHGKPFQMMAYPGKHHGLEGAGLHWAGHLTEFVFANL